MHRMHARIARQLAHRNTHRTRLVELLAYPEQPGGRAAPAHAVPPHAHCGHHIRQRGIVLEGINACACLLIQAQQSTCGGSILQPLPAGQSHTVTIREQTRYPSDWQPDAQQLGALRSVIIGMRHARIFDHRAQRAYVRLLRARLFDQSTAQDQAYLHITG